MQTQLVKTNIIRFTVLYILLAFYLTAENYIPKRFAFPAICIDHFDNNVATKMTWLEAAPLDFIDPHNLK
jgi:hypothetical protein